MMNCRPGKPFPAKDRIGDFLNQSKNGVIFMSFGSIIKPSAMPKEYKEMILNVFARFPQYDFIWKWDEELQNAPKNVLGTYRVSQVKLDKTKWLFQTENTPWGSET